jgi:sulfur carrier protein
MPLSLSINGQPRIFETLSTPTHLAALIEYMDLKADRIAVEHNGEIAPRARWHQVQVNSGDRLEVVHFVGGGNLAKRTRCTMRDEGSNAQSAGGRSQPIAKTLTIHNICYRT